MPAKKGGATRANGVASCGRAGDAFWHFGAQPIGSHRSSMISCRIALRISLRRPTKQGPEWLLRGGVVLPRLAYNPMAAQTIAGCTRKRPALLGGKVSGVYPLRSRVRVGRPSFRGRPPRRPPSRALAGVLLRW